MHIWVLIVDCKGAVHTRAAYQAFKSAGLSTDTLRMYKQGPLACLYDQSYVHCMDSAEQVAIGTGQALRNIDRYFQSDVHTALSDTSYPFAVGVFDKQTACLHLARDPMGVEPLFYLKLTDQWVVSNDYGLLTHWPDIQLQVNEGWIADHFAWGLPLINHYSEETFYHNIQRVKSAEHLSLSLSGEVKTQQYWDLKNQVFEGGLPRLRKALFESVERASADVGVYGAELSGGLDSSVVVALAARHRYITAFSNTLPSDISSACYFGSEWQYAKTLIEHAGVPDHCEVDAMQFNLSAAIERATEQLGYPAMLSTSVMFQPLWDAAQSRGMQYMLSGFGGDECVTSPCSAVRRESYLASDWRGLWAWVNPSDQKANVLKKWYRYLQEIMRQRYPLWAERKYGPDLGKYTPEELGVSANFATAHHKPGHYEVPNLFHHFDTVQERQYADLVGKHCWHMRMRLEETALMAGRCGMRYRYPFLDPQLLQAVYSAPNELKRLHGQARGLIRELARGYVPDVIRLRHDKSGFIAPGVQWAAYNQLETLQHGISADRSGYINKQAAQRMIDNYDHTKGIHQEQVFGKLCFIASLAKVLA